MHADHLWYYLDQANQSNTNFDIFEDAPDFQSLFALTPTVAPTGSPVKRSTRKQRFERSVSTSALNNITNSVRSASKSAASFLKMPGQGSNLALKTPNNLALDTPSKVFDDLPSSPSKLFLDLQTPSKMPLINDENLDVFHGVNLSGIDTPDFLEENEFPGFDMLAGFEKIGSSNAQASRGTTKPGALGRSYTSTF
jgi:hypothetical protein